MRVSLRDRHTVLNAASLECIDHIHYLPRLLILICRPSDSSGVRSGRRDGQAPTCDIPGRPVSEASSRWDETREMGQLNLCARQLNLVTHADKASPSNFACQSSAAIIALLITHVYYSDGSRPSSATARV